MIILRVSLRGRGGQTPRASRGGHPVLREEDIPRSSYACNFGHGAISRVTDTLNDIARFVMDTLQHCAVCEGHTMISVAAW